MNRPESDRIHELCSLIAVEQDREKFIALVEELNRILEAKGERPQSDSREPKKEGEMSGLPASRQFMTPPY